MCLEQQTEGVDPRVVDPAGGYEGSGGSRNGGVDVGQGYSLSGMSDQMIVDESDITR